MAVDIKHADKRTRLDIAFLTPAIIFTPTLQIDLIRERALALNQLDTYADPESSCNECREGEFE